ncbi:MAG: GTP-dependent dephospho-CoA kinase family protein [Promethearchaeota archaeon]
MAATQLRQCTLVLPKHLRESLKGPKGKLFSRKDLGAAKDACTYIRKHKLSPVIAVGDLVSINLMKVDCQATLSIIDGKTKRNDSIEYGIPTDVTFTATNAATEIRPEVWIAIELALAAGQTGKTAKLLIEGEEDLTALPAVALAPNGSAVVYGLPDQGIVVIKVASEHKQAVHTILQKMVQKNENQD